MHNVKSLIVVLLMVIAAVVFAMQINKENAWLIVCLYWAVLTIKNIIDIITVKKEGEDDGKVKD